MMSEGAQDLGIAKRKKGNLVQGIRLIGGGVDMSKEIRRSGLVRLVEEREGALYSEGIFRYPRKKDVVLGKQKIF